MAHQHRHITEVTHGMNCHLLCVQGKKFYGDGIGFWITSQPFWVEGDHHGISPSFTGRWGCASDVVRGLTPRQAALMIRWCVCAGIGVVFDTFKNTEQGAKHRDVAVYTNDGKKTADQLMADFEGW